MVDILNLDQENPEYEDMKDIYYRCNVFSNGGHEIEGKQDFLKRHAYETQAQYDIRLWLTKYRNHARPVIGVFHSAIWETVPDRGKENFTISSYFDNVDKQGTNVNNFFSEITKDAITTGISFVLIDHTELPSENTPRTKKEADRYNLRPFFRHIKAQNLIDWSFEENVETGAKELSYIVIKEDVEILAIPFIKRNIQKQYTLWTKDKWEVWTLEETKAILIHSGKHKCGVVPIVPCVFDKKSKMSGYSAIYDIVGLCERIYRNGSCLDKSLYDTAFPLQLFLGFTIEQVKNFRRASSTGLIGETGSDSKYIEPNGRSFEELRLAISSDENAIKEIALRMIRPESKVAESAESKRLDEKQLNTKLSNFALNVESCEVKCWDIFLKWLDMKNESVNVEYSTDFNDKVISVEILSLFRDLADMQYIPADDIIDLLIKANILPDDYDKEEAKEKIKDQNRYSSDFKNHEEQEG